ncbi:Mss4-like protein [Metarhizium rileyi]|uniref:Mss4-like protein n=1 Tax=Metarhizium rileyi (strain RCEF 4871) TaxID=1649241 RepID=A0A166X8P9_METRR|nr:Mss4-like protein [Metarhizium rileyi RCEF 4871]TWU71242.1 hypothetical protein ED733_002176 [Metarhizium rileyi]
MANKPAVKGGCYCGKVQYMSTEPVYGMTFCYCSMCRLLHGAPFAPWTNISLRNLQWIRDQDLVEMQFSEFATRTVCGVCRAPITMTYKAFPEEIGIVATSIDEVKSSGHIPRVKRHIYVGERPSWYQICDDGVQYDGLPEDMQNCVK